MVQNQARICSDWTFRKTYLPREVKRCNRLPRELFDTPCLSVLKRHLDNALNILTSLMFYLLIILQVVRAGHYCWKCIASCGDYCQQFTAGLYQLCWKTVFLCFAAEILEKKRVWNWPGFSPGYFRSLLEWNKTWICEETIFLLDWKIWTDRQIPYSTLIIFSKDLSGNRPYQQSFIYCYSILNCTLIYWDSEHQTVFLLTLEMTTGSHSYILRFLWN